VSGGKGSTAHFVWRCGTCKRESSAKFEKASPPQPYKADANGQFAPLVIIECRGLEFVGFDPKVFIIVSFAKMKPNYITVTRVSGGVSVSTLVLFSMM
jgi:hypothetical protein